MATEADLKLRKVHVEWIASQPYDFDIAVAWHLPKSYKAAYCAYDHLALSRCLRRYFHNLDGLLFKTAYKRKKVKLPRAIVLEHSDTVGWHAHGLVSSQSGRLPQDELIDLIMSNWHQHVQCHGKGSFSDHLTWAKPSEGAYTGYMMKKLTAIDWEYSTKIDYVNCHLPT